MARPRRANNERQWRETNGECLNDCYAQGISKRLDQIQTKSLLITLSSDS